MLEALVAKAKQDCGDALRTVLSTRNGQAGVALLRHEQANGKYVYIFIKAISHH